ncbi:Pds5 [Kluyveromyces lactis]|nr:Pds5 [Kluyveromyces lactis]
MQSLEFNKSIIPSLEDSFSSAVQIERLGELHEELAGLEQGKVELNSLEKYKNALINRKLLRHKDSGIRALTACCLSDIMRLNAPDAPFTETELCDIFRLFLSQFRLLRDPDNGNFIQQTYLITRLLECRSIVLITDLPPSKRLVEELFQVFYEKVESQFPSKLWKIIGGLLTEVVSECDTLSMDVLRLIFNAFLTHESRANNTLKGLVVNKDPSFEFSLIICESATNRLGRHFSKFYSEILYGITNENEGIHSVLDSSYRTLRKLHRLTSYIWQYTPELVHSVIGFVYQELCSDNVPLRLAATELITDILSFNSTLNFVTTHADTFQIWLSKMADISPKVRVQWAKCVPKIIETRSDICEEIAKGISKTFIDTDETVRLQSIRSLAALSAELVWARLKVDTIFKELLHLIRDKSKEVRQECISYVCQFYDETLKEDLYGKHQQERNAKQLWDVVNEIPTSIFNLYYINDPNINMQVDSVIFNKVLNLDLEENAKYSRLVQVVSSLSSKALSSFFAFNKRQVQINKAMNSLFELKNEKLDKLIEWLAATVPKQLEPVAIIQKFLELNDSRINHLIKVSINQETDYITLKNSLHELKIKLEDPELFRKKGIRFGTIFSRESFNKVILLLVYRAAPLIYNVSCIPYLLNNYKRDQDSILNNVMTQLIQNISEINPSLFKCQTSSLSSLVIQDKDRSNIGKHEQLKTLYKIFKAFPGEVNLEDGYLLEKLQNFATSGNIAESKYAVKIIALIPDSEKRRKLLSFLRSSALPLEFSSESPHLLCNNLCIISQLFKVDFDLLKIDCNEITTFILKDVLVTNEFFNNPVEEEKPSDWITDDDLLNEKHWPITAKILCLEVLTNRMLSEARSVDTDCSLETVFHKILKLFLYFVSNGGEVINEENEKRFPTPLSYQRRIRCHAGLQILKLAKIAKFNKWIESKYIFKLINLVEDESFPVRREFVNKLKNYISNEEISIKFIPLVFFMPYEPDTKFQTDTKIWINFTFQKETARRGAIFERSLPRLLHCIAHHPDIEENLSVDASDDEFITSCSTAIDYVLFFLDTVLKPESISLLYYLAGRIKQYKDLLDEAPTCIYVISELVQMILNELKQIKNLNLTVYPGKLNLPSDLYVPFENMELAQANTFKTFIKDDYTQVLEQKIKLKCSKMVHGSSTTTKQQKQQRKLTSEYKQRTPSKKKRHYSSDSDDDSDSAHDRSIYPSPLKSNRGPQRKSTRSKTAVDYNEDDENEEVM